MKTYFSNKKGFTLIELLVVVAIISLLSSVIFASLNTARAKARDVRRMEDLKQLQLALALYYDKYGNYPSSGGAWRGGSPVCSTGAGGPFPNTGPTGWIPNLAPEFISVLPNDPKPGSGIYECYIYQSYGVSDYIIFAYHTIETYGPTSGSGLPNFPPPPYSFRPIPGTCREGEYLFAIFSPGMPPDC